MNESSENITLEDIYLESSPQNDILSNVSSVHYEKQYKHLSLADPQQQHILMNKINIQPEYKQYIITFYQTNKDQKEKKIATAKIFNDDQSNQIVRLPPIKGPVNIQVKTDQILTGNIISQGTQTQQSNLYDLEGRKKASLFFHLIRIPSKTAYSTNSELQNLSKTLDSKDFEEEIGFNSQSISKIDQQLKNTLQQIQEEDQHFQTIQTCQTYLRKKRKKRFEDNNENQSQIEEISGEDREDTIYRINQFRTPIEEKSLEHKKYQINFNTIRRCQEELGLSNIDLQSIICMQKRKQDSRSLNFTNLKEKNSKNSHQKNHKQCEVQTYSPLLPFETSSKQTEKQFRPRKNESVSERFQKKKRKASEVEKIFKDELKEIKNIAQRLNSKRVLDLHIKTEPQKDEDDFHLPVTHFSRKKQKKWESCRMSSFEGRSSETGALSKRQQQQFCYKITIHNLGLDFNKNISGEKYIEISNENETVQTSKQGETNLIWTNNNIIFENVTKNTNLIFKVKKMDEKQSIGKMVLSIHNLLVNQKQKYYQNLVLSQKDVLGVMTIGFELGKSQNIVKKYSFPREKETYRNLTQMKGKTNRKEQTTITRMNQLKPLQLERGQQRLKLLSPKTNAIKIKKYRGGKNIKIGRAHRFDDNFNELQPGPADYSILSSFSRHAIKED